MKQILQNLKTGETLVEVVPAPIVKKGQLLIRTKNTLISAGTEKMLVEFGKGNLIQKAKSQPDKVKQVIEKIKTDGLKPTWNTVKTKLETPLALGYCNVGLVDSIGAGITEFNQGDRVLSNGKHAEVVVVPKNLCVKIPDNVDDESASFTVIGAIALQGIRLLKPTLGETVVVTGLGLIGLVAVQLLKANGCRVLGLDFDDEKLALAKSFGAEVVNLSKEEDPLDAADKFTRGRGVDAVLITASTSSNEPIHQAATMCRKRGRIVLVGVVGMELSRADFYEKELSFQVSCSYGPGRYDASYEEKGNDYPLPYVRWTEQRNFEAILELLASGQLNFQPLISHRYSIDEAEKAYELVSKGRPLGIILSYPRTDSDDIMQRNVSLTLNKEYSSTKANLGFIGAGDYTSAVLLPAFAKTSANLVTVCSSTGVDAKNLAKKYNVDRASSDAETLLNDDQINSLVIATRHDSHAHWVTKALQARKNVYVEKPLVINREELKRLTTCLELLSEDAPILMLGFNRRYAPLVQKMKKLLLTRKSPISIVMTVNAGVISSDHWLQDPEVGGGRIIGEVCHFVDLVRFLADSPINKVQALAMESTNKDSVIINLKFKNGSIACIQYLANGAKSFPKERLEVYSGGGILCLDNFKSLTAYGWPGFSKQKETQDKGQENCTKTFVKALETGDRGDLIPLDQLFEVAEACFNIVDQI